MFFRFVVGNPSPPLPPNVTRALAAEAAEAGDLLTVNVTDSYATLGPKSLAWFAWAGEHTQCDVIFKTDVDTYIRIVPLLDFLRRALSVNSTHPLPTLKYIGKQVGTWEKGTDVMKNPNNRWYMYDMYPHDTYPPYMEGAGYGVSRDVTAWLGAAVAAQRFPPFRVEDAGVGIMLSEMFREPGSLEYVVDKTAFTQGWECSAAKVLDNPAYSRRFSLRVRHADDVDGAFCTRMELGWSNLPEDNDQPFADFVPRSPEDGADTPWNRSGAPRFAADAEPWPMATRGRVYGDGRSALTEPQDDLTDSYFHQACSP